MKLNRLISTLHFSVLAIISGCLTVPMLLFLSKYIVLMEKSDVVVYILALLCFSGIFFILAKITRLR